MPSSVATATIRTQQTLTSRMRNLANITKPAVDISFHNEDESPAWVTTYASRDTIKGTASIAAPYDTRFDNVEIAFIGFTKTWVDKMGSVSAVHGRSEAFHKFLQLNQPIDEASYPQPRVAEAGRTYSFPFTFVVPDQMLISSCRHKTENDLVRDAHLQLPPSMGDPELSGQGTTLLDDMSPEMSRISYGIRVTVTRQRERDGKHIILVDKTRKVRVIPAYEEQPPVDIDGTSEDYVLRTEKSIRKGVFKGKIGRLVMEAAQPRSLQLRHPKNTDTTATSTVATVMLRWDPADPKQKPPPLSRLSNRLKVTTFFASAPRRTIPTKRSMIYDMAQGLHVETLNLSSRCMSSAQWIQHEPFTNPAELTFRRGSTSSVSNCPAPSEAHIPSNPFWTAQLLVPIELPKNKAFVPTFHSCLVSRIYILDMQLNVQSPGNNAGVGTNMTLKLPIQVSSEGNDWSNPSSPNGAYATLDEEADDPFRPRNIAPPRDEYLNTSRIGPSPPAIDVDSSAPPDYSYFAPTTSGGFVPVSA